MKYTITEAHRKKIALATHSTGAIATVAQIALGSGGMDGEEIKAPVATAAQLNNEVLRKEYTSSTQIDDFCYEYALELGADELVGTSISEMALIDSDGDPICFLNFYPKVKDDIHETYRIRNHYA